MNGGLILLGILIAGGMFFLANVYVTPQEKQQVALIDQACNLNLQGIPLGQIGQSLNADAAQICERAKFAKQIMAFEMYGYGLGGLLLILGLVTGGQKEVHVIREVERHSAREEAEDEEDEDAHVDKKKSKGDKTFCAECGSPVTKKDKFCKGCGAKQ